MPKSNDPPPDANIDVTTILESWDMSNSSYPALLEKQRKLEEDREKEKEKLKTKRGVWRIIRDTLVPA
jgi:hypothetical protein